MTAALAIERPRASSLPARERRPGSAARRLARARPGLLPEEHSVSAFVAWVSRHGETGEQLASDLFATYLDVAEIVGWQPMTFTAFGRELGALRLPKGKREVREAGKRSRPTCYILPG